MRGEDTILGTALARAVESQPTRSTPFERSRLAVRMAGGGRRSPLFPVLAAAAAVVLGLALGAALVAQRGPTDPGGVATQPSPTASPGATASPAAATPKATPEGTVRIWVYFARDQLPPVGAYVRGTMASSGTGAIASRLIELIHASPDELPPGTTNVAAAMDRGGPASFDASIRADGDLATVEFAAGAFDRVRGSAASQALLQQLVYTITEEPGIRRALIKEKGKRETTIDQLVIDKPLTREDVLPYEGVKTEQRVALEDDPRRSTATTRVEQITGGVRFVIELKADQTPEGSFWSPALIAAMAPNSDPDRGLPGKWLLEIQLPEVRDASAGDRTVDSSPLRAVQSGSFPPHAAGTIYTLALDDARPWRISLEPASSGTMWLIVDIGGHPQAISDSVAVYVPRPGDEITLGNAPSNPRTFVVKGTARAFEAHVAWRLKDANQREVATGFVTASLGTSPVWGTFTTEVKIPDSVSGIVTLEVFWPSPRDGADVGTVAVPLRIR